MKQNKIKNLKSGFTLLEILVVVLIIGVLASIALPKYQMAVAKAKYSTLKENAHVIKSSLDRYFLAHDTFTNNLEDLDIELSGKIRENNKSVIDLSDGSVCFIGGDSIFCYTGIFKASTYYIIEYKYTNNRIFCLPNSDLTTRLCQLETGKKEPRPSGLYQY